MYTVDMGVRVAPEVLARCAEQAGMHTNDPALERFAALIYLHGVQDGMMRYRADTKTTVFPLRT